MITMSQSMYPPPMGMLLSTRSRRIRIAGNEVLTVW